MRHDLFHKGKRAIYTVNRERPLEKPLCHDLVLQDNDTPAWCGSLIRMRMAKMPVELAEAVCPLVKNDTQ
ncbi:hypothetical protein BGV10_01525 [Clostridioides difficile]|nr:hypothetical protein BGV10_01525 [Clostridioides difficile]